MLIALTGATGFVGRRTLDLLLARAHEVRALARRPQEARDGVTWVTGALDDGPALLALVVGADAVVHIAGVVNAPDRAGFAAGNINGTRAVVDAAARAGLRRFVHVSSLAAREPGLSLYGWSKAEAERVVTESDLNWTIVRPPAVYGPGDLEQLDVFRLAKLRLALLPPPGRMSAIMVDDLAALLVILAERGGLRTVYEVDDGRAITHADYARAIGRAVGRRVLTLPLPAPLLRFGARLDRLARGPRAKLTPDRAAYMAHPDWAADPAKRPPPELWTPRIALDAGLAETVRWYRAQGLL
ncbi:NAD-dependent epimerase/dehydratase family protein [Sphingomonas lenta]|uniref:Epimerase n=1 Tax=Sphingomonas lenta TaxID=1141887 RepID=A0A2A2SHF9_9SPHN|nr:NAD(P)-dependent oxidoreductase [Sphingomonas lenta]PAX08679.1 epimerase [Sphingomonas lenta]